MRTADLLQFNGRLLLRQRFRTAMSLLAIIARGGRAHATKHNGLHYAHR